MRETRWFFLYQKDFRYINGDFKKWEESRKIYRDNAKQFVQDFGLPELNQRMAFGVSPDSDIYKQVVESKAIAAEKYGLTVFEHGYTVEYSKSELSKADFLLLKLCIYGREDYTEDYQTEFEDIYCPYCHKHQHIPKGIMYINKSNFRNYDIATTMNGNYEVIVSDNFKNLVDRNNLTGVKFFPAYHHNNRLKKEYTAWHMIINSVLPEIDQSMPVRIDPGFCDKCCKHHIIPLSYPCYTKDSLKSAMDFSISTETYSIAIQQINNTRHKI